MHRASRSSRRDGGDATGRRFPRVRARAVPSACLPFVPRRAGTIERGSLFVCRVATASETPSRERCGSLRRPGGPQSNRQFLPVVLTHRYAVRGFNSGDCGVVAGFIPAVNGGAFSSYFSNKQVLYQLSYQGYLRGFHPLEPFTNHSCPVSCHPKCVRGTGSGLSGAGLSEWRLSPERGPIGRLHGYCAVSHVVRTRSVTLQSRRSATFQLRLVVSNGSPRCLERSLELRSLPAAHGSRCRGQRPEAREHRWSGSES